MTNTKNAAAKKAVKAAPVTEAATEVTETVQTPEEVKTDTAENKAEEVKTEETVTEVKKAPAKKTTAKKTTTASKTAAKTTTAKKTTAAKKTAARKTTEVKTSVSVQYAGKSYTTDELIQIARDVWEYDLNEKPEEFVSVDLYVKPEENAVYYVINETVTGSFHI